MVEFNIGEIINFGNIEKFPNFEKYKTPYYLNNDSILIIEKYNEKNKLQIENYDILGWALEQQIGIDKSKGARGVRYLFWNTNNNEISDTILELIGLSKFEILSEEKLISPSAFQQKIESYVFVKSLDGYQRFMMSDEKIDNLLIRKKNKNLDTNFLFVRDFLPEKPKARGRGSKYNYAALNKLGIIQWKDKWELTELGIVLLDAIQSWIVSYITNKLSLEINNNSLDLPILQQIDILYHNNLEIDKSELFQIFGNKKHYQHLALSKYATENSLTWVEEKQSIVLREIITNMDAFFPIETKDDLWNFYQKSVIIPVEDQYENLSEINFFASLLNTNNKLILIPGKIGSGKTTILFQIIYRKMEGNKILIFDGSQDFPLESKIKDTSILIIDSINYLHKNQIRNLSHWFNAKNQGNIFATVNAEELLQFRDILDSVSFPKGQLIISREITWHPDDLEAISMKISNYINQRFDPKLDYTCLSTPYEVFLQLNDLFTPFMINKILKQLKRLFEDKSDWISEQHKQIMQFLLILSEIKETNIAFANKILKYLKLPNYDNLANNIEFSYLNYFFKISNKELELTYLLNEILPLLSFQFPSKVENIALLTEITKLQNQNISILINSYPNKDHIVQDDDFFNLIGKYSKIPHLFYPNCINEVYTLHNQCLIGNNKTFISNLSKHTQLGDTELSWLKLQLKHSSKSVGEKDILVFMKNFNINPISLDEQLVIHIIENFNFVDSRTVLLFLQDCISNGYFRLSEKLTDPSLYRKYTSKIKNQLELLQIKLNINKKEFDTAESLLQSMMSNNKDGKTNNKLIKLDRLLQSKMRKSKLTTKRSISDNVEDLINQLGSNPLQISVNFNAICDSIYKKENWELMEKYVNKVKIKYPDLLNEIFKIDWLRRKAICLRMMLKYDEAIPLLEEALKLALKIDGTGYIARIYGQLGTIEEFKGNNDNAINLLKKSYSYCVQLKSHFLVIECINQLGNLYGKVAKYDNAISWLLKGHELVRDCKEKHCIYQHRFIVTNLARAYWFNNEKGKVKKLKRKYKSLFNKVPKDFHKTEFKLTRSKQESDSEKEFRKNIKNEKLDLLSEQLNTLTSRKKLLPSKVKLILDKISNEFLISNEYAVFQFMISSIDSFHTIFIVKDYKSQFEKLEEILLSKLPLIDILQFLFPISVILADTSFNHSYFEKARFWYTLSFLSVLTMATQTYWGIDANVPFNKYLSSEVSDGASQLESMIIYLTHSCKLEQTFEIPQYNISIEIVNSNLILDWTGQNKNSPPILLSYLGYLLKYKKKRKVYNSYIEKWDLTLIKDPNGAGLSVLGRYWDKNNNWELMSKCYEMAIIENKNPDSYYFHLGYAYLRLNNLDAAERAYEQVSSVDPKDLDAKSNLLEIYLTKKEYAKALEKLDEIDKMKMSFGPGYASFFAYLRSHLLDIISKKDNDYLDRAIELFDSNYAAHYYKFKNEYVNTISDQELKKFLILLKGLIELNCKNEISKTTPSKGNLEFLVVELFQAEIKGKINEIPENFIDILYNQTYSTIIYYQNNLHEFRELLTSKNNPLEIAFNIERLKERNDSILNNFLDEDFTPPIDLLIHMFNEMRKSKDMGEEDIKYLKYKILRELISRNPEKIDLSEYTKISQFLPSELLYEHLKYMEMLDYEAIPRKNEFIIDLYKHKAPLLRNLGKVEAARSHYKKLLELVPTLPDGWEGLRDCDIIDGNLEKALEMSNSLISIAENDIYKIDHAILELHTTGKTSLNVEGNELKSFNAIFEAVQTGDLDKRSKLLQTAFDILFETYPIENFEEAKKIALNYKDIENYESLGELSCLLLNHYIGKSAFDVIFLLLKIEYLIENPKKLNNFTDSWIYTLKNRVFAMEKIDGNLFYIPAMSMAVLYLDIGNLEGFQTNLTNCTKNWKPLINTQEGINELLQNFKENNDPRNMYANLVKDRLKGRDTFGKGLRIVREIINVAGIEEITLVDEGKLMEELSKLSIELLLHLLVSAIYLEFFNSTFILTSMAISKLFDEFQEFEQC